MIRKTALSIAGLAFVAACGSTPATSSTPTSTVPGQTAPTGTTNPNITPLPSLSLVPDQPLEDAFPDDIGGVPLEVESASGPSVLTLFRATSPDEFNAFLVPLGKTIDDVSAATAFVSVPNPTDPNGFQGVSIFALRVRGADSNAILAQAVALTVADLTDPITEQATVGGKTVTTVHEPDDTPESYSYLYPYGDAVFLVGGSTQYVEEALSKLP